MNNRKTQQIAVGFGLFSMALMAIGSLIAGSGLATSIIRGFEGGIIFGLLAWFIFSWFENSDFSKAKVTGKTNNRNGRSDAVYKND